MEIQGTIGQGPSILKKDSASIQWIITQGAWVHDRVEEVNYVSKDMRSELRDWKVSIRVTYIQGTWIDADLDGLNRRCVRSQGSN